MKSFKYVLFFAVILFMASCTPNRYELWFNEDGSGKVEVQFDMGQMAGMVQKMVESLDTLSNKESESNIWGKEEKVDSSIVFYNIVPDSIKQQLSKPELLHNMKMSMNVDSEQKLALMTIGIKYASSKQLEEILEVFSEIQEKKNGNTMGGGNEDKEDYNAMFKNFDIDMSNGIIRIPGMDIDGLKDDPEFEQMLAELEDPDKSEDPQFLEFMKMMFGGEKETIVHAPGEILFTSDMDAKIDGNTVIFKDDILEVLKSGVSNDRIIRFEK